MADLKIDETGDTFIDKSGDVAYATGQDAFEQKVMVALLDHYEDLIGENDPGTILEEIRVGARRAVSRVDDLDNLKSIDAQFKDDEPNTLVVDILFDTGEPLSFTL